MRFLHAAQGQDLIEYTLLLGVRLSGFSGFVS